MGKYYGCGRIKYKNKNFCREMSFYFVVIIRKGQIVKKMIYFALLATEEDRESFRQIYEENYLKMYHVALGMLGQPSEAENAVHEAFLALAERFEKYSHLSGREMTGFCVSIVKNKTIDMIRLANRYSEAQMEELVLIDETVFANPENAFAQSEQAGAVQMALRQVSDVYRETLILKYYYGFDNREIGKIQNVSKKTVEMRLYRGKQKLREILHEADAE